MVRRLHGGGGKRGGAAEVIDPAQPICTHGSMLSYGRATVVSVASIRWGAMPHFVAPVEGENDGKLTTESSEHLHRIMTASERLRGPITEAPADEQAVLRELPLTSVELAGLLREMLPTYPNPLRSSRKEPPDVPAHAPGDGIFRNGRRPGYGAQSRSAHGLTNRSGIGTQQRHQVLD